MEPKYVTDEDREKYNKFFAHHVEQIAKRKTASVVCHYTSGDTLIKILDSASLWSTQVACLNDSKEMTYAIEAFLQKIEDSKKAGVHKNFRPCLDYIEQQVQRSSIETSGVFVTCFSSKIDDLSQWRAYGGTAGYAIQFDLKALQYAAARMSNIVVPVLYGREETNNLFDDAINWAEKFYIEGLHANRAPTETEWISDFGDYWLWNLSFYAPMIKHESFRAEEEWRLIHHLTTDDVSKVRVLQRASMMSLHLPLALRTDEENRANHLPIKSVMVGPTVFKQMSEVSVADFLKAKDYKDVDVQGTSIPYRPYL